MRLVIHAGMHKTGSSSIQNFMFGREFPGITYAPWKGANHSALLALLFLDAKDLPEYHLFKSRGADFCAKLPEQRKIWLDRLTRDIEICRDRTYVFSAEDISNPRYGSIAENACTFFCDKFSEISIIAYVRSPLSFANSAFQQRLKGGGSTFNANSLWPKYRRRFEGLERVFGKENVTLKPYDTKRLIDGDVVKDFLSFIGSDAEFDSLQRSNYSLSAEATALLFCQRSLGNGFIKGFDRAHIENERFIKAIRSVGSSRLTISSDLWGDIVERNAHDLKWVEARLGEPLVDRFDPDAKAISSESDLLDLALGAQKELEEVVRKTILGQREREVEHLVRSLDFLRQATQT